MLWAACCTGFLGFLRSAEFTSPKLRGDVEPGLSVADVSVDSLSQPSYMLRYSSVGARQIPLAWGRPSTLG